MNKAYTKIDNLCCLNANKYGKDFFQDYEENNNDEDFCKDTNEMVDCLETIKQSLDRLEKLKKVIKKVKDNLDSNYDLSMTVWYKAIGLTEILEVFENDK